MDYLTGDTSGELTYRSSMLPIGTYRGDDGRERAGLAWPQLAMDAVDAMEAPGELLFGEGLDRDESQRRASIAAGLMMSGGLAAPIPSNSLAMFGGRLAKTADHNALAKAEALAKSGAPREQIWNDTGWFQGTDGKWRFEIDDSKSQLNVSKINQDDMLPTHEILDHGVLFEAYPDLAAFRGTVRAGENSGGIWPSGWYAQGNTPDEIKSTALHELQHAVQRAEGFHKETGSYDDIVKRAGLADGISPAKEMVRYEDLPLLKRIATDRNKYESNRKIQNSYEKSRYLAEIEARYYPAYRRAGSEVESRAVQTREGFSPSERSARAPWLDYDVPETNQLFSNASPSTGLMSLYGYDDEPTNYLEQARSRN